MGTGPTSAVVGASRRTLQSYRTACGVPLALGRRWLDDSVATASGSGDDGEGDVEAGDGLAGDDVAQQRCRRAVVDVDFHHRARQSRVAVEDDDAVAVGAAHELDFVRVGLGAVTRFGVGG